MGVLDQVIKMKKQGITEEDIISDLSQQGNSPREINDALKQAQIKNAVSNSGEMESNEMQPSMMPEQEAPAPMQEEAYPTQETYTPAPQQNYSPRTYSEQPYSPSTQEEYQQPQQQYYSPTEGYAPSAGVDTDTIIEISDQIFSEKIKKFQNQIDASSEMNVLLQTRMENVSERLKRIETMIDKLQLAILEKVGSYGQNLESVKKEMSMMQDSFSKMISSPKENRTQMPHQNYPQEDAFSDLKKIGESKKIIPRK
jgi:hypothetical protein